TLELNTLFDADWNGSDFVHRDSTLLISPFDSREKLTEFLDTAARNIRIMDAKLTDEELLALLLRKAQDGVDVKVIGRDTPLDKIVPNFHVRQLGRYKLHAKCIVVDGTRFFVGSQNLRAVSLDRRREVGIIIEDEAMARKIERVFDGDWLEATEISPIAQASE
ncbi:MAG TPA: phospholipase D-like domain-containing protein, partial [Blastocatellia bacterium]|nr:phospholipase D-like domain-containing protein [Blastocatellia bacterium]